MGSTENGENDGMSLFIGLEVILAFKFIDSSGSVQDLLFAGVKRMADVADIDVHRAFGGAGLKGIATGADHVHLFVFGMDSLFHCIYLLWIKSIAIRFQGNLSSLVVNHFLVAARLSDDHYCRNSGSEYAFSLIFQIGITIFSNGFSRLFQKLLITYLLNGSGER